MFASDLPDKFGGDSLPEAAEVIPDVPYFRGSVLVLGLVLLGYFAGSLLHVPPYAVALAGCAVLMGWGMWRRQVGFGLVKEISWPIFPFVIGLFVVVQGVENLGLASLAARGLAAAGSSPPALVLASAFGAGVGANVVNNIPMALLSISALHQNAAPAAQYGALLGCDLGPNLTVAGSLATMLVITSAPEAGGRCRSAGFLRDRPARHAADPAGRKPCALGDAAADLTDVVGTMRAYADHYARSACQAFVKRCFDPPAFLFGGSPASANPR